MKTYVLIGAVLLLLFIGFVIAGVGCAIWYSNRIPSINGVDPFQEWNRPNQGGDPGAYRIPFRDDDRCPGPNCPDFTP